RIRASRENLRPFDLAMLVDVADVDARTGEVEHREAEQRETLEATVEAARADIRDALRLGRSFVARPDGHAAVADQSAMRQVLPRLVDREPVLVAPEPGVDPV